MNSSDRDILHQFDSLLGAPVQSWLFGAGISFNANIPLMSPLTHRVFAMAEELGKKDRDNTDHAVLTSIKSDLLENAHIEHVLSQIADNRAIAARCTTQTVTIGENTLDLDALHQLHQRILGWIAETIRWGYRPADRSSKERIGKVNNPIVTVDDHCRFVSALFHKRQKGLDDRRHPIRLFTTNYDTLIEDALGLETVPYWDGFSGGAVAFRNFHYGDQEPLDRVRARVVKLHGSIDWHLTDDDRVLRVRDQDLYPERTSRLLIYPQSTKYVATQRDPFSAQFDLLRRTLSSTEENVLAICGYSFGDDHINDEIALALSHPGNKTTVLAFAQEVGSQLKEWQNKPWSRRLYIITDEGLWVGKDGPYASQRTNGWWKFEGVANLLESGPEACVNE